MCKSLKAGRAYNVVASCYSVVHAASNGRPAKAGPTQQDKLNELYRRLHGYTPRKEVLP